MVQTHHSFDQLRPPGVPHKSSQAGPSSGTPSLFNQKMNKSPNRLFPRDQPETTLPQTRKDKILIQSLSQDVLNTLSTIKPTVDLSRAQKQFAYAVDRSFGMETSTEYLTGSGSGGLPKTLNNIGRVVDQWTSIVAKQSDVLKMDVSLDFIGRRKPR